MSTPEELHSRLEQLQKEVAAIPPTRIGSDVRLAAKHSEIFVAAAQLAELSSRRLERQTATLIDLTRSLKIFTVALVALTLGLFAIEAFHLFERHRGAIQPAQNTQQTNQARKK